MRFILLALAASTATPAPATPQPAPFPCRAPRAVDGDTLRCANAPRAIRMIGIDAPEMPGHCRPGRACVPGNGHAARRALAQLLAAGPVRIHPAGHDRFGRMLASISVRGSNPACVLIRTGNARYVARWDSGRITARACGMEGR